MQLPDLALTRRVRVRSYGAGGFPAWGIMPNSTLIFEIEVLSAK